MSNLLWFIQIHVVWFFRFLAPPSDARVAAPAFFEWPFPKDFTINMQKCGLAREKHDLYIDTLYICIHYWYVLDHQYIICIKSIIYTYWYFILWFPPFVWCRPSPKLVVKEWLNPRKKKWRIHRALCVFLPMSSFWQFNILII